MSYCVGAHKKDLAVKGPSQSDTVPSLTTPFIYFVISNYCISSNKSQASY